MAAGPTAFDQNLIKGEAAQTLVARLFVAHGIRILPFGVETRYPEWTHDASIVASDTIRMVRAAPDFIAFVPEGEGRTRLFHVEVKFRATGQLLASDVEKHAAYPDTILVVVGHGAILASPLATFLRNEQLCPIAECLPLDPLIVQRFEALSRRLFTGFFRQSTRARTAARSDDRRMAESPPSAPLSRT